MPEVYDEFVAIANRLEHYFKDMQDMEFTIEDGKLYMLQTRNGKRTAQAALQIACDLVDEGMITEREAVLRVEPKQLDTLLHPQFDAEALKKADAIGKGLAASPGSACGQIVFSAEEAEEAVKSKTMPKVVLVRLETSPEDIVGMQVSQGILTVRGGMTSHAAVVARGMGTCCVSGCGNDNSVHISYADKVFEINGHRFTEGDWISLDGSTGNIYAGQIPTVAATGNQNFNRLMGWADAARRLNVEANADNPRDAQQAVSVGGVDKIMQLVNGSFAQRGGPDFSLYLDASVFLSTEMDGKCCFARADDTSMDAYLEIGYHPGADAQTLAGTILNDYGTIANTETLGQVKLGDLNAYGVNGATVQKQLEAYLIQTADGCVSVVLCRAGTAPVGWYESLLASAQTLQITG